MLKPGGSLVLTPEEAALLHLPLPTKGHLFLLVSKLNLILRKQGRQGRRGSLPPPYLRRLWQSTSQRQGIRCQEARDNVSREDLRIQMTKSLLKIVIRSAYL